MAESENKHQVTPIVFIHGQWLHATSWNGWIKFFRRLGYIPVAPGWPGESDSVHEARLLPEAVAGYGVDEIARHYARWIAAMDMRPVVIGHSFGGLVAQKLLCDGLAAAAVAIAPIQPQGVLQLPLRQLAASWPALRNPFRPKRAVSLTVDEFRYSFGNALSREEAVELYTMWSVPSPALPFFQMALASISSQATKANVGNAERGPLLLIAAGRDNMAPPSVVRAQQALYQRSSTAVTDLQEFDGRGHSLHIDSGWREVAIATFNWLKRRVHQQPPPFTQGAI